MTYLIFNELRLDIKKTFALKLLIDIILRQKSFLNT